MFSGHFQPPSRLMPAGPVHHEHDVRAGCDAVADLGEVEVHHVGIGEGQHQRCACAARRADRAEQVSPAIALVARRCRSRSALGPDPGERTLLTDARLVLPPELDRLGPGVLRQRRIYEGGEVSPKDAWRAASWPG